jgi:hypothetical protein
MPKPSGLRAERMRSEILAAGLVSAGLRFPQPARLRRGKTTEHLCFVGNYGHLVSSESLLLSAAGLRLMSSTATTAAISSSDS